MLSRLGQTQNFGLEASKLINFYKNGAIMPRATLKANLFQIFSRMANVKLSRQPILSSSPQKLKYID